MFNQAKKDDVLNICNRTHMYVRYEHDVSRNQFKLFERKRKFFDTWSYVNSYKTLEDAQEAARSRAISVTDMGLTRDGIRQGMTGWLEEAKVIKTYPELTSTVAANDEVKVDKMYIRKVPKPGK